MREPITNHSQHTMLRSVCHPCIPDRAVTAIRIRFCIISHCDIALCDLMTSRGAMNTIRPACQTTYVKSKVSGHVGSVSERSLWHEGTYNHINTDSLLLHGRMSPSIGVKSEGGMLLRLLHRTPQ